jgi:FkbM family methyltransferase
MKRERWVWVSVILVVLTLLFFFIRRKKTENMEMSAIEYNDSISFLKPDGTEYSSKDTERIEQETCDKFINNDDIVLELGSRYGTLSCLLAKKSKFLVSLDPDVEAVNVCKKNMERHNVKFEALHGILSKESQKIVLTDYPDGYGKYTEKGESDIPNFSIKELENKFDLQFNTLVADCERCMEQVLNENDISNIRKICFETDRPYSCNYDNVYSILRKNGLKRHEKNDNDFYQVWIKNNDMVNSFKNVYETKLWGDDTSDGYNGSSGGGSTLEYNINTYVPFLKNFIKEKNIKSVCDLGCGSFICGKAIYDDIENIKYTGYDIYEGVINKHNNSGEYSKDKYEFIFSDFYGEKENIKSADLCIIKDVIQHWPLSHITNFMDYLVGSNKFKYILVCNCTRDAVENSDISIGDFRPLSFDLEPMKKYGFEKVYAWDTKEIGLIDLSN